MPFELDWLIACVILPAMTSKAHCEGPEATLQTIKTPAPVWPANVVMLKTCGPGWFIRGCSFRTFSPQLHRHRQAVDATSR